MIRRRSPSARREYRAAASSLRDARRLFHRQSKRCLGGCSGSAVATLCVFLAAACQPSFAERPKWAVKAQQHEEGCRKGGELPAFPGALGFGARATGGRGGRVVHVTTLAADGAGSLQAALDQVGSRIVVFDVAGVIERDIFEVRHGDVTIAGQTAPGAGITLRGQLHGAWDPHVGNIIVRHVRVRPRYDGSLGSQFDAIRFSQNHTLMLDHVSAAFAVDENIDVYSARDVTVQWSTIENGATEGHEEGPHNYGLIHGPDARRITLHHNLFVNQAARNPAVANGPAEVFNNVVYNARIGFCHHNPAMGPFNLVGNYFKAGPSAVSMPFFFDDEHAEARADLSYYVADNWVEGARGACAEGPLDNPWTQCSNDLGRGVRHRSTQPFTFEGAVGVGCWSDPKTAYRSVLNSAGAFPRDLVTRQAIADVRAGTGSWGARQPSDLLQGLHTGEKASDVDADGMSDPWELERGLDPRDPSDGNTRLASGYTAIEVYLNELADALAL